MKQKRIILDQKEMPRQWYNILADLKLNPPLGGDGNPIGPEQLAKIFPMNLIEQEVSTERWIDIPEKVLEILSIWRPSPITRAYNLEKALDTPAKIYIKNENVSPAGSHKPNTAVAQAYYNKEAGIKKIITETGAGQWGSALAFATQQFGIDLEVYMVRVSFDQKPYRKIMMKVWGADCIASPSKNTEFGKKILKEMPDTPGSLGIAISEAIERTLSDPKGETRYALGSVLNHVMLHQSIIGLEAKKQLAKVNEYPDVIIGCAGGGSNFAGLTFPFINDKMNGKEIDIYAVEPTACPTLTKAPFAYDFGDVKGFTPLLAMYSLGHNFIPPPVHAGGLRYHGMAPTVSQLVVNGLVTPDSIGQLETFEAGVLFARTEGIIPAPETNHAIAKVIREAKKAKEEGKEKTILFNFSGHGLVDLSSYENYQSGNLKYFELSDEQIAKSEEILKQYPTPAKNL
ncbi:MAG: TrpB-like pyridoxal phosphate-dependent enzyme [Candidatus Marinimicrobia bacterium]|nr:TrpB-like pyridoxal phosphate-dependent enzyme [Candidatus Neomarinimicrobiota bacterium]